MTVTIPFAEPKIPEGFDTVPPLIGRFSVHFFMDKSGCEVSIPIVWDTEEELGRKIKSYNEFFLNQPEPDLKEA